MKNNTPTILLGVSLAVVAGLFSANVFGLSITKTDTTDANTGAQITGHVVTTLRDADGNIKEYRQSDNLIVNQGENCVLKMLFSYGDATTNVAKHAGTTVCTGEVQDGFHYIGIGNTTSSAVASSDYKLYSPFNTTATSGLAANSGLFRKAATMDWQNSNTTGSGAGTVAKVVMSATFTSAVTNPSGITVTESGLFNATDATGGNTVANTDAMFAHQVFSSINMKSGDSLTVQWTVNVGGTSSVSNLTP